MIEITLNTIHVGTARRVVTLGLDGKDLADEFLSRLIKSDPRGAKAIKTRVQNIAEHDRYEHELTFRSVGGGIYEFKRPGLRLYAFYDDLPGLKPQLIIASNGGTKNDQNADIARAQSLRASYLAAKSQPTTKIRLIILSHEN
jgi:putative component of toxin-antitoxin plasmid stabilization module